MAKVSGPGFSLQCRGKLGDLIYSHNRHGDYVRDYVVPTDPSTAEQLLWRSYMSDLNDYWKSPVYLSAAQIDLWRQFAANFDAENRLGHRRPLSARDWFVKFNIYRLRAGLSIVTYPPRYPSCNYFPVISLSQENDGLYVDFSPHPTGNQFVYISTVAAQNTTRFTMPATRQYADIISSGDSDPSLLLSNASLTGEVKRYFYRFVAVDIYGRPAPPEIQYIDAEQYVPPSADCPSDADTYMTSAQPNSNFSSEDKINLTYTNRRGLIAFDFSAVPAGATITKADMQLYFYTVTNNYVIKIHRMLVSWVEDEATWNDRASGTAWNTSGCGSGTDYAASAIDSATLSGSSAQWLTFDISSYLQDIIDGTYTDYGLFLWCDNSGDNIQCRTKEYADSDYHPYVEVEYTT